MRTRHESAERCRLLAATYQIEGKGNVAAEAMYVAASWDMELRLDGKEVSDIDSIEFDDTKLFVRCYKFICPSERRHVQERFNAIRDRNWEARMKLLQDYMRRDVEVQFRISDIWWNGICHCININWDLWEFELEGTFRKLPEDDSKRLSLEFSLTEKVSNNPIDIMMDEVLANYEK